MNLFFITENLYILLLIVPFSPIFCKNPAPFSGAGLFALYRIFLFLTAVSAAIHPMAAMLITSMPPRKVQNRAVRKVLNFLLMIAPP
jgi:hypothetical protein